ncbi:MAG: transporter substrate-binding domain-containing protein [Clostridia bacterium]|nr:transporter substrate-binding domain-containing protein [Clostridia bacterium]
MKKLLSVILSISMLFAVTTVVFAAEDEGTEKIIVGINAEYPPFEYYDENGELTGFDIELMSYIGERIGFEIEYVDMSFGELIPAVTSGKVDCAMSAITYTEERAQYVDYSELYLSAKVTYFEEGVQEEGIEEYGIVFPVNFSEKAMLANAAGVNFVYSLVNEAVAALKKDGTVEKLAEKYNLNKAADSESLDFEYTIPDVNESVILDIPSDWAKSDVEKASALAITEKKPYAYRKSITREEFCELIYNYCENVIGQLATVDRENKFTDTNNTHIFTLNAMGIINGKSETEFAPQDYLTREEAAVILNRMTNATIPVPVTEMYFYFDDEEAISNWASASVQVMCNMGVMNGVGDNKFAPQDTYTTEQAIATIVRVYAAQAAHTGIIGGSDVPTEISVSKTIE